jgi:hypothetical protein
MFQLALSKIIHRNANLYIFLKFLDQIGRPWLYSEGQLNWSVFSVDFETQLKQAALNKA